MEPENGGPFVKEIPIKKPSFAGSMLNFGGVITIPGNEPVLPQGCLGPQNSQAFEGLT